MTVPAVQDSDRDLGAAAAAAGFYVGGFPLHFERRLWEVVGRPAKVLHPFGRLAEIGDTVDLNGTTSPTWVGDAHDLHWISDETYDLVILDPPYRAEESEELYWTPRPRWYDYTREAVRVSKVLGHVAVYLDKQPARPEGTRLVRRIVVLTRTWHRPRVCFIFEKLGAQEEPLHRGRCRPRGACVVSEQLPELLDARRLREELGVSRATAEAIMRKLPTVQLEDHRKVFVRRDDVAAYLRRADVREGSGADVSLRRIQHGAGAVDSDRLLPRLPLVDSSCRNRRRSHV